MNSVEAVYDGNQQLLLLTTLTKSSPMMGAIFLLGVASGLRVSDLLTLNKSDLARTIHITESKTKKPKIIHLTKDQHDYLVQYAKTIPHGKSLFPTSRTTVYRHFNRVGAILGLQTPLGTHTMRKTYLWNVFLHSKGCIETVRLAANHKYTSTTITYLRGGITMLVKRYARKAKKGITPSVPHTTCTKRHKKTNFEI